MISYQENMNNRYGGMNRRILRRPAYLISGIVIILFIYLSGCIEPFDPDVDKYDNALIVDGVLTNEPGSCEVILSRTYPYNQVSSIPEFETGATVTLIDDLGTGITLIEQANGRYVPADDDFAGQIGRKYKITVETTSGIVCESDFEELKEPVPVGRVYYRLEVKENGIPGLQFYVDTEDPSRSSKYYAWEFMETWEFWVPYIVSFDYATDICYRHVPSRTLLTATTKNYSEDKIIGYPIHFVGNNTNRLSVKYSILVKQFVLTEATYNFYEDLKTININVGTLFDVIPVILTGNIRNSLGPEYPILGNFQVSGVSEMRIFIYDQELPSELMIPTGFEFCQTEMVSKVESANTLDSLLGAGWIIYETSFSDTDTLYDLTNSRACYDCTRSGSNVMPDFWGDDEFFDF